MNSIAGYPIDVVKMYTIKYLSKTTDHPIEKGADITDNIQALPVELSMECVVADIPIGPIAKDPTRQNTLPAKDAYDQFVAIHDNRQPVVVELTLHGTFVNMVMTELTVPVTVESRNALMFTVSFKQIIIVSNNRTTVRAAFPNKTQMLGDKPAKVGPNVQITYCVRFPFSSIERANNVSLRGQPVTCVDAGESAFDHYKVDPKKLRPDGYMTPDGHWNNIVSARQTGASNQLAPNEDPAPHYNPDDNTYEYPDGSKVTQDNQAGNWNRMTGKVPS